jgi:very-short-patch-repair endonuclease
VAATPRPAICALQISAAGAFSQSFILDFVCFEKRIIIEIDGSQHASSERDMERETVLKAEGFRIERYWNNDVLQRPSNVLEDILAKLVEP